MRWSRAVAPALAGVLGAVVGTVAGLVLHWHVFQPSDHELLAAIEVVTPTHFAPIGEPVISGAWAPSFTRGAAHVDASTSVVVTLGEVADELRADGWEVDDVDPAAVRGDVRAERGGLVATVHLSPQEEDLQGSASLSVRRGPAEPSIRVAASGGAVAGTGVAVGAALAVRRSAQRGESRARPDSR
jgi:hypothetical protein